MSKKFEGFKNPRENWSKLPHQIIGEMPNISSLAEMKVILYILRHTWGYGDDYKKITLDEFEYGRKKRDGSRIDNGIGMSKPSIVTGLKNAEEHGFIFTYTDSTDTARVKKYYSLEIQGLKSLTPDVKKFNTRGKKVLHRTEKDTMKDTIERLGASAKSDFHYDDLPIDYEHEILSLLSDEWMPLSEIAMALDIPPFDLTEIVATSPQQISLEYLSQTNQVEYTMRLDGDIRHYRLAQPDEAITPRKKMNHRESYIHAIEQVMNTKALKTDEALYYKVASALVESTIGLGDFEAYYKFVCDEAKETGEWAVTVPSLISNGRPSRYAAKRDTQTSEDENNVGWEWA